MGPIILVGNISINQVKTVFHTVEILTAMGE